jgi:hypothetical protein
MATFNTQTSVVDYLKSKGQDSSFASRSTLAKQYGINDYAGTAEQNTQLYTKLQTPATPTPTSPVISQFQSSPAVATSDPIRNVEAQQKQDQQLKDQELDQQLMRAQKQAALQQLQTVAPERPDLVGTYNQLREDKGIAGLETQAADIRKRKLELKTEFDKAKAALNGQGTVQGVVNGATSEEAKKIQEQLDKLSVDEQSVVDQINTGNSVIETIMNLTSKDYDNARDDYQTKFTQAVQTINLFKGIEEADKSDEERRQDNARANLQILANQLSSGDLQFSQLDPATQAQISKLELQAGLPTGTIASIKDNNPKADIVSTTTRTDPGGNAFTDIVIRDKDTSALTVQTVSRGKERIPASSSSTPSDEYKFTKDQLQKASGKVNIPLHDLTTLPGEVINVFTSGQYDELKKQVKEDLEDFKSPQEIERDISDSASPDAVKDALVRYLKTEAKNY